MQSFTEMLVVVVRSVSVTSQPHKIYILGTCHVCMFWFRMNNICDNRQASKD